MEFDLYVITNEGMKLDLKSPQLLPEEKFILTALTSQPYTVFGLLTYIKNNFNEEYTHYKIKQTLLDLKEKGYVELRE